ncbi:MAG: adenosine kinase [Nitrospinaceae bacterium]
MEFDLVGIGNALVDIEVRVEDGFIEDIGITKGGMTLSTLEDQQKVLAAVSSRTRKIVSGGSAANTVHGLGALGGRGYYLGRVADDDFGQHYTQDMKDCGVGFPGPDAAESGTGTCVILVTPDSERTMLTHLGISARLHPDNVDETIVRKSRMSYIEGYLWTGKETREAALRLAREAKAAGVPVAFTLSDAFVVNSFRDELIDFIRWNVDILFCNEIEARAMFETGNLEGAFDQLRGLTDLLFLTRGKEGSWAVDGNQSKVAVGVFPVKAVDTTGAGDLFAAGVLFGLGRKLGIEQAAILGSYCASEVVSHMGGRLPAHCHTDVKKILGLYAGL